MVKNKQLNVCLKYRSDRERKGNCADFVAFSPSRNERPQARTKANIECKPVTKGESMKKNMRNMALAVSSLIAVLPALAAQAADEDLRTECQQAVADLTKTDTGLQKFLDDSA